ncbi:MAG: hypothetical protein IT467_03730 [Dokdonella sp.]|nr:hypothetical protein [Dokdonella sp.]
MNDFELQRRLLALHTARAPQADLWPAIAARITVSAKASASRRHPRRIMLAAAASLLLALTAGAFGYRWLKMNATTSIGPSNPLQLARTHAPNDDPRLLSGAIVLDAAKAQIEQAMQMKPQHPLLTDLLKRTQARRSRLDQFGQQAG